MKLHLLAFEKASAGAVTLEDVPGIQDDIYSLNASNHYLPPWDSLVVMAYVLSPNAVNAQISTPHFRQVALPAITPQDVGTAPTSLPSVSWYSAPYPVVKMNDELTMLQTDNAGGAIQKAGLMLVAADMNMIVPQGEPYTLRATSSNTAATKTWTSITPAFDQTLPAGTYAVIGMDAIGAHMVAARLILPGGGNRPGCIARTSEANKPDRTFRMGRLGEWGRFTNTAPPTIQVLGDGTALTTQQFDIDVVKVG